MSTTPASAQTTETWPAPGLKLAVFIRDYTGAAARVVTNELGLLKPSRLEAALATVKPFDNQGQALEWLYDTLGPERYKYVIRLCVAFDPALPMTKQHLKKLMTRLEVL
jgi:hypothetical protein